MIRRRCPGGGRGAAEARGDGTGPGPRPRRRRARGSAGNSRRNRARACCRRSPQKSAQTIRDMPRWKPHTQSLAASRARPPGQPTSGRSLLRRRVDTSPGRRTRTRVGQDAGRTKPCARPRSAEFGLRPAEPEPVTSSRPRVSPTLSESGSESSIDSLTIVTSGHDHMPASAGQSRRRDPHPPRRVDSHHPRSAAVFASDVESSPGWIEATKSVGLDDLIFEVRRKVVLHAMTQVGTHHERSGHVGDRSTRSQDAEIELVRSSVVTADERHAHPQASGPIGEKSPFAHR